MSDLTPIPQPAPSARWGAIEILQICSLLSFVALLVLPAAWGFVAAVLGLVLFFIPFKIVLPPQPELVAADSRKVSPPEASLRELPLAEAKLHSRPAN
jgi:hypothetical protein